MKYIYGIFRDTDHALIYVGMTKNPKARMSTHRSTTFADSKEPHYMEFFEVGENLAADDEVFWISYMAGLGCQLKNRVGVSPRLVTKSRSYLETVMREKKVRPERVCVKCNIPYGAVVLAMKGMPLTLDRARRVAKYLGIKTEELVIKGVRNG